MNPIINSNRLPDFISKSVANLNSQRIISLALPLLSLNPITARVSSVGVGLYQCYSMWTNKDVKTFSGSKWADTALLASSITLSVFFPMLQLGFSSGVFFGTYVYKLLKEDSPGLTALQMTQHAVHLASLYYRTPLLMGISLVSQAGTEIVQAYHEERTPERCVNLLMAAIRLYTASQYLPRQPSLETTPAHQGENNKTPILPESNPNVENAAQIPLKKMSQEDWNIFAKKHPEYIFAKRHPEYIRGQFFPSSSSQPAEILLDVKTALQRAGFSSDLDGLDIQNHFTDCLFAGLNFKNCSFDKMKFNRCLFDQTTFELCSFKETYFISSSIGNSHWISSDFSSASFFSYDDISELIDLEVSLCKFDFASFYKTQIIHSNFYNSTFEEAWIKKSVVERALLKECDLSSAYIQNSIVKESSLEQTVLQDTHWFESTVEQLMVQGGKLFQCVFFDTTVTNSQLVDCDLKNALLLDAKNGFQISGGIPHQVTGPIVALGWNFDTTTMPNTRLARKALIDQGALVIKYSQREVASETLQMEVTQALHRVDGSEKSIGQQLLEKAAIDSEITLIKQRAANLLKVVQGLVIPGGADIEECFYRQGVHSEVTYRSLLELALIAEAQRLQMPTLGICRGAQMINLYFGGTLKNVEGHSQTQQLEWTESSYGEQLKQLLHKDFVGYSSHKQAADRIGEGLHVVLKHGDVPKLMISHDKIFLATQFHPERYITKLKNNLVAEDNQLSTEQRLAMTLEIWDTVKKNLNDTLENMPTTTPIEIVAKDRTVSLFKEHFENIEKTVKKCQFISSNRDIYGFFIKKIKSLKPTDSSPPL